MYDVLESLRTPVGGTPVGKGPAGSATTLVLVRREHGEHPPY
jgi:hypothetical protein